MAKSTGFQPPAWVKDPKLPNCGIRVRKGGKIIEEIESLQSKPCLTLGRHKGVFLVRLDILAQNAIGTLLFSLVNNIVIDNECSNCIY